MKYLLDKTCNSLAEEAHRMMRQQWNHPNDGVSASLTHLNPQ